MNPFIQANEIQRKINEGEALTQQDVDTMFTVAKKTSRMEDRILYAQVRKAFDRQNEGEE